MIKSKYYNLDGAPATWTSKEFRFAVLTLERLSLSQLFELLERFKIRFNSGNIGVTEEDAIAALLDDISKGDLLDVLKKFG